MSDELTTTFSGDWEATLPDGKELFIEYAGEAQWERDEDGTSYPDDPNPSQSWYLNDWNLTTLTVDGRKVGTGADYHLHVLEGLGVTKAQLEVFQERVVKAVERSLDNALS